MLYLRSNIHTTNPVVSALQQARGAQPLYKRILLEAEVTTTGGD